VSAILPGRILVARREATTPSQSDRRGVHRRVEGQTAYLAGRGLATPIAVFSPSRTATQRSFHRDTGPGFLAAEPRPRPRR
jgi:hypothetical protein